MSEHAQKGHFERGRRAFLLRPHRRSARTHLGTLAKGQRVMLYSECGRWIEDGWSREEQHVPPVADFTCRLCAAAAARLAKAGVR